MIRNFNNNPFYERIRACLEQKYHSVQCWQIFWGHLMLVPALNAGVLLKFHISRLAAALVAHV